MKNNHGGKRNNAGRKPVADKKQQVSFYIEKSKIKQFGGIDKFKDKIYDYIERTYLRP